VAPCQEQDSINSAVAAKLLQGLFEATGVENFDGRVHRGERLVTAGIGDDENGDHATPALRYSNQRDAAPPGRGGVAGFADR